MTEDLVLARGKGCKSSLDFGQFGAGLPRNVVLFDCTADGLDKIGGIHGFGEEIDGSTFHSCDARRKVTVPGKEDDWQQAASGGQRFLQLKPVQARHREVKHQATRRIGVVALKKLVRRSKRGR